ncbi:sigma factor [Streptomyces griseoviridis]|uniref:RNA polymerase sigma-70 region 2 domain-containing protein n=1 Tax=Streptomyces griseoviridis TaxID=45398 RepID=A0A918GUH0_STRGD|nr:sigma factor [Streptomyces niveoruber]GGS63447.1 hypothetical protein GCM10010238_60760 [Streptomyces niveoruber]
MGAAEPAAAYRDRAPLVRALARRAPGDARDAEDVTQQVYAAAWHGRRGYRPERGTLRTRLLGIARRKTAGALAARTRRSGLVAAAGAARTPGPGDPAVRAETVLDRLLIRREPVKPLPAQQTVLRLALCDDLSQTRIAERAGRPLEHRREPRPARGRTGCATASASGPPPESPGVRDPGRTWLPGHRRGTRCAARKHRAGGQGRSAWQCVIDWSRRARDRCGRFWPIPTVT